MRLEEILEAKAPNGISAETYVGILPYCKDPQSNLMLLTTGNHSPEIAKILCSRDSSLKETAASLAKKTFGIDVLPNDLTIGWSGKMNKPDHSSYNFIIYVVEVADDKLSMCVPVDLFLKSGRQSHRPIVSSIINALGQ